MKELVIKKGDTTAYQIQKLVTEIPLDTEFEAKHLRITTRTQKGAFKRIMVSMACIEYNGKHTRNARYRRTFDPRTNSKPEARSERTHRAIPGKPGKCAECRAIQSGEIGCAIYDAYTQRMYRNDQSHR
jgi:hypothetical protein